MKVTLSVLSAEEMQKTLNTISNAMIDCFAFSTHMVLLWSHFQDSQM